MAELVTLADAKSDLRVTFSDDDADIARKIQQASEIVLDYVTTTGAEDWTVLTCPPEIQAAVHIVIRNLYDGGPEVLSKSVKSLLRRHRDPALA